MRLTFDTYIMQSLSGYFFCYKGTVAASFTGWVGLGWFGSVRFGSFFIIFVCSLLLLLRFFNRPEGINRGRVFFRAGQSPQRGYILKTHNLILYIYPLFPRFLTCVKLSPSRWYAGMV
jgi:hypothetical protein